MNGDALDISVLESWLWEAACSIRGDVDAPKYKEYILPLIFLKRLSDVFEDELTKLTEEYGSGEIAEEIVKEDPKQVRFYLPPETRWSAIARQSTNLGEYLTDCVRAVARDNPRLQGVIDVVDFNASISGQRILTDNRLRTLVEILGRHRLGLDDVVPDIIGRAYEYLLRKFAEGSGSSAGEFYTPREVAILMARCLDPQPGEKHYDPCCGSGGLLIKNHLRFKEKYGEDPSIEPPRFYGQEILSATYAMARMNTFLYDMEAEINLGDTMHRPAFQEADGGLRSFDVVTANPMWNQKYSRETYESDPYQRFSFGTPPSSSADWGWIQHMYASLKPEGRLAVVLDTGAVSRGSGTSGRNAERDIRRLFVDRDLVEAVFLLPENLFYNTTAPGIILLINTQKRRPGETLLVNASPLFEKGRPKNYLSEKHIEMIARTYLDWRAEEGLSTIITQVEAVKNDYNLSPSRYVAQNENEETLSLPDAILLLWEAEEEAKAAQEKLWNVLKELGVEE